MAYDTLTFEMGGRVELRDFAKGIDLFARLVNALTSRHEVTWVIEDLHYGSAVATFRGEAENIALVEEVVAKYAEVGKALEQGLVPLVNKRVAKAARDVRDFADDCEYLRLETALSNYTIVGVGRNDQSAMREVNIGSVEGWIQTLTNRGSLRFNLYDTIHDKAVACYLEPDQDNLIRNMWGRRARVVGRVSRNKDTGRPMSVRQIAEIVPVQSDRIMGYKEAKGILPHPVGGQMPEEVIRQLRDG